MPCRVECAPGRNAKRRTVVCQDRHPCARAADIDCALGAGPGGRPLPDTHRRPACLAPTSCRGGGRWSHAFRSIRCVGELEIVGPFRDRGIGIALVARGGRHETTPSQILASGLGCCGASGRVANRQGTSLSDAVGAPDRTVPSGRCGRFVLASHCSTVVGAAWPNGHYREPSGARVATWGPRRPCARRQTATRCFL